MNFLKNNAVKYGLALTVSIAIWITIMHMGLYSEKKTGTTIIDYFYILIPLIGLYFGIKEKKHMLKNKFTLKTGIWEGFYISLVYAILSPFVFYIYYIAINPESIEFAKKAYGMEQFSTKAVIFADMAVQFIFSLVTGLIFSLITSYFLARKKK